MSIINIKNIVGMRQLTDTKRLQFSKISNAPRVLENIVQNQYYVKPCETAKKVTFGARLTNLSNSNVSMISSTSSLSYQNGLNISRASFETQPISNENRMTFNLLRNENVQPLTERQSYCSGIPLVKKTHSNIEEQQAQPFLNRYKIKPPLEQSSIIRYDSTKLIDYHHNSLQKKLQEQSVEISNLKKQLEASNMRCEEEIRKWRDTQSVLEHSVMQLNLVIFELRNNQQYQRETLLGFQEKNIRLEEQKDSYAAQNQQLRNQITLQLVKNQKLEEILKQLSSSQKSLSLSFEGKSTFQLQKTINNQNITIKAAKSDLKRCEEKVVRLQRLIDKMNDDRLKEGLFNMDKAFEKFADLL